MTACLPSHCAPQLSFLLRKGWLWGLLLCLLASCGSDDGRFRLEGRFRNLNQGEFYIYNTAEGWKDTIPVRDGRFVYERPMPEATTLRLIFPNYSELPVFAASGVTATMEGDASHLRETEIEGSDDNEEMTAFRMRANKQTPPEVIASAEKYIRENPKSQVSLYLLRHYFLESYETDYAKADKLCALLQKAMPDNGNLVRLKKQLEVLKAAAPDTKLPAFTATDINGRKVSSSQLKAPLNVITVWSSWSYETTSVLRSLRKLQKKNEGQIAAITICLEANPRDIRNTAQRDSIDWPIICDSQMWESPLVKKLGIATLPVNIIVDKRGTIIDRKLPTAKALEEKLSKLLPKDDK